MKIQKSTYREITIMYVYRNPSIIWEMILRQCLKEDEVWRFSQLQPLNLEVADLWEIVCQAQY